MRIGGPGFTLYLETVCAYLARQPKLFAKEKFDL